MKSHNREKIIYLHIVCALYCAKKVRTNTAIDPACPGHNDT